MFLFSQSIFSDISQLTFSHSMALAPNGEYQYFFSFSFVVKCIYMRSTKTTSFLCWARMLYAPSFCHANGYATAICKRMMLISSSCSILLSNLVSTGANI